MLATGNIPIDRVHTFLIYDQEGKIHHIHEVVVLRGGRMREEQELTQEALKMAGKTDASGISVLAHDGKLEPGKLYKINPKTKTLVSGGMDHRFARSSEPVRKAR